MEHRGTSPAGFFLNAQSVDMRNGLFNNFGGDQVTVFNHVTNTGHPGEQIWNYDTCPQNVHFVNDVTQTATFLGILTSTYSILHQCSLIQAQHDALGRRVDVLTTAAVAVTPTILLMWFFMRYFWQGR